METTVTFDFQSPSAIFHVLLICRLVQYVTVTHDFQVCGTTFATAFWIDLDLKMRGPKPRIHTTS